MRIHPEPLLKGRDLVAMGFSPGPIFQKILKEVEEAQLDGEISRKDHAEKWAREIHPEPLLKGRDLVAMGFSPGPIFQKILKEVEEAHLDGEISRKDHAKEWVLKLYGNPRENRS